MYGHVSYNNDTDIINGGGIMGKLNKESSVPLYQQLMEVIQNQILNGELKENDRIPTAIELSREYDVSRIRA